MIAEPIDVSEVLLNSSSIGAHEIGEIQKALGQNPSSVRQACQTLRERALSGGSERDLAALGVALHMMGSHDEAIECLSQVTRNGYADHTRGSALVALERFDDAIAAYKDAANNGYDQIQAALSQAGTMRMAGRIEDARELLKQNPQAVNRADYSYQQACILADVGDIYGAIEYFERAVDMDPHHQGALFRLGALNSSFGNDEEAISLYERCLSKPPYFLGALMNLGLLYEDFERYNAAAFCFQRVLEFDSTNDRARLYLKDIEASDTMVIDEDTLRRQREEEQALNTLIADFELSARSRNCLDRMGISTLGDLTRISEAELLASKNFGETSLKEVREILGARNMQVGSELADKRQAPTQVRREELTEQQRAIYDSPVADLNLSVRARKCVSRLAIASIGELMNRTPDELLGIRNFGVTSLNEIRAKMTEMGVSLRND
jgi:DNA-directed RNA polymerase subunit alpha